MNVQDLPWIQLDDAISLETVGHFRGANIHPTRESPPWCVAFFVLHGRRTVRVFGCDLEIKEGQYCILPSLVPHYGVEHDTHDAYFLHFYAGYTLVRQPPPVDTDSICLPLVGACPTEIDTLRFMDYIHNQSVLPYCSDKFTLTQVRALLYQLSMQARKSAVRYADRKSRIAEEVMQFLRSRISMSLDHRDYEQEFGYTYKYLNGCFAQRFGTSIKQMQVTVRIEHAKALLSAGYSIQEAADLSGFSDYHFFLKNFHAKVGLTPTEYCRQIAGNGKTR